MVTKIIDQDFKDFIAAHPKVVVKFYADWCGSCRLFAPKYTKLSNKPEFEGIQFLDINAEENPETRKFAGVNNLPYFAIIKDGELLVGDNTAKEEGVEKMIQQLN